MVLTKCKRNCCEGSYTKRCTKNRNCSCHPKKATVDAPHRD